jgi:hypothetical protein
MNRFLIVTSNDKTSDSVSNSDFKVRLGDTYFSQQVCGISVVSCTVPNVIYNINEHNNRFLVSREVPPLTLTESIIPIGQYTISQLMSAVSTAIFNTPLLSSLNITITQDPITQKLVFKTDAIQGFKFYYTSLTLSSTIWEVLGLDPEVPLYTATIDPADGKYTIFATYIPNLSGNQYLNILSNLSENNSIDGVGVKSLLEIVNLFDTPFGSFHTQSTNMAEHAVIKYVNPRNLNNITIKLVDEKYRDIDIGNFSVTVVLRIYFD